MHTHEDLYTIIILAHLKKYYNIIPLSLLLVKVFQNFQNIFY
nr:MAG TPA: hypothetical protein [Caudoviricetes sp.]